MESYINEICIDHVHLAEMIKNMDCGPKSFDIERFSRDKLIDDLKDITEKNDFIAIAYGIGSCF